MTTTLKELLHHCTYVSNDSESAHRKAWELLKALSGECREGYYKQWFEGSEPS